MLFPTIIESIIFNLFENDALYFVSHWLFTTISHEVLIQHLDLFIEGSPRHKIGMMSCIHYSLDRIDACMVQLFAFTSIVNMRVQFHNTFIRRGLQVHCYLFFVV